MPHEPDMTPIGFIILYHCLNISWNAAAGGETTIDLLQIVP